MCRFAAVIIVLFSSLWVEIAAAQTVISTPIPFVYRIKIDGCTFEPVARRQTGFRVEGLAGIVTALHGVADCQTVSAVADDEGTVFTDLVITAVDIDRDMALLISPALEELPTEGLAVSTLADAEILSAALRIVGYPLGLDKQDVDTIERVRDIESLDDVIPDSEESEDFLRRKSPAITIDALNVQAQLLPGHSGAPLLDEENGVVAVGDGGLRSGTVARSWAIPWQTIAWKSVDIPTVKNKLAELAAKDVAALSFSSTYPSQVDDATALETYTVRVVDGNNQPVANAEVLLTHSAGYEIGVTDSEGFYIFQLPTDVSYLQSQIQVEAPGYPPYSRTLRNVLDRVGAEVLRLTARRTPSDSSSADLCEFAFRILDAESSRPIANADVNVTLGTRLDTGQTDSNGFYGSKLPCTDPFDASVRVRVVAQGYNQHSEIMQLVGEVEEILLAPVIHPAPLPSPTVTKMPLPPPQPVATATPVPTETPRCQVVGVFSSVWRANVEKLGCNTSDVITSPITYEPFENGYIVWMKRTDLIYVLPKGGFWSQHTNSWSPDESRLPCSQAQQFGYPAMGFGKLWCTAERVRTALGNPLGEELPNEFAQQQQFEGGFIFEIFGGKKIVLFEDGTWSIN